VDRYKPKQYHLDKGALPMIRLLLVSLLWPLGLLAAGPAPTLSVCEAIMERSQHNGELVALRGEIAWGGHGNYMVAPATCSYRLVTKGLVWPNVINLRFPNNHSPDPFDHAPFTPDLRAIEATRRYLVKVAFADDVDIELATYVGLLVTFSDLDRRVSPGVPGAPKLGFGPVGLEAPVQLLIKTIENVSVIKGGRARRGEK
jgi:hypothetical protein